VRASSLGGARPRVVSRVVGVPGYHAKERCAASPKAETGLRWQLRWAESPEGLSAAS